MAEPMMENPLAPETFSQSASPVVHFSKVIQDIKDCIKELKQEFDDSGGIPINDDIQPLHRFCAKLEYLLQSGLKVKSSLLGGKKDYWNYFCDSLSSNKSLNDGLRFVKTVSEIKTNLGRGRAFLRFALMHQRLADTMQQCVYNGKITQEWYHPKAAWFLPKVVSELINALYDLNDIQFDLSPRGYDLDASWPSFARRTFGSPYSWAPPSRTISISSLSSTLAMEGGSTPTPSPLPAVDPETMKLKVDLSVSEVEKQGAEKRVEQQEQDISSLKQQLSETQKKCNEYEVKCDKLANELKLKEVAWEAREKALLKTVEEVKAGASTLHFASDVFPATPGKEFDMTEMKGKLLVMEKKNKALSMDVKRLELELESKARVDGKKTQLIGLLDKKLESVEAKKAHLMNLTEDAIRNKETQAKKLNCASDQIIDLTKRLTESDEICRELKVNNAELKAMLSSLEGKGKKVTDLALDKLRQYSTDNKSLKEEMEKLTEEESASKSTIVDLQQSLNDNSALMLQQIGKLVEASSGDKWDQESRQELSEIHKKMASMEEAKKLGADISAKENEALSNSLKQAESLNKELKAEIEALKAKSAQETQSIKEIKAEKATPQEAAAVPAAMQAQGQAQRDDKEGQSSQTQSQLAQKVDAQETEMDQLKNEMNAIKALLLQKVQPDAVAIATPVAGSTADPKQDEKPPQDDVVGSVKDFLDRFDALQDNLRILETERSDLSEQLKSREMAFEEKASTAQALEVEKAAMVVQLTESTTVQGDLTSSFNEQATLLNNTIQELVELKSSYEALKSKMEDLERSKDAMDADIQGKELRITELTGKMDAFNKEIEELGNSQLSSKKEKDSLQRQLSFTEGKMAEMEENFEGIFRELEMLKDEKGAILMQKEHLQKECESMQMERLALVCKAEGAEEKLQQVTEEFEGDRRQFESERYVREGVETDVGELRELLDEKDRELQACIEEKDSMERAKKKKVPTATLR